MSQNLQGLPAFPYNGSPYGVPMPLKTAQKEQPKYVPFYLQWLTYGAGNAKPALGINITLVSTQVANPIQHIKGIYIDNTGNNAQIYVVFPDSGFSIPCPPGGCVFSPVITNGLNCTVYGTGFFDGFVGETRVYLCNTDIEPFTDTNVPYTFPQEKASPIIGVQNNVLGTSYGSRALGDNFYVNNDTTSLGGTLIRFSNFIAPQPGYIIMTNIHWQVSNVTGWSQKNTLCDFGISDGLANVFAFSFFQNGSATILDLQGCNLKMPLQTGLYFATFPNTTTAGRYNATVIFTFSAT